MRTAKEIFNGYKRLIDSDVSAYWCTEKDFIEAINKARVETKKNCFAFIVWKDKNTTRSYREYYTLISEPGSNYTLDGLWRYWVKNVKTK